MRPGIPILALFLLFAWLAAPARAGETGAPSLPRFASLRADEVNLRAGPGTQFQVEWVFQRRNLPAEIIAEYGQWRKIRDADGSEGWVHQSLLSGQRWAMVIGGRRVLRRDPAETAPAVARVEPGVLGRLLACSGAWCRLRIGGDYKGWLPRGALWGVYPDETFE